jgi:hypothetical protein
VIVGRRRTRARLSTRMGSDDGTLLILALVLTVIWMDDA